MILHAGRGCLVSDSASSFRQSPPAMSRCNQHQIRGWTAQSGSDNQTIRQTIRQAGTQARRQTREPISPELFIVHDGTRPWVSRPLTQPANVIKAGPTTPRRRPLTTGTRLDAAHWRGLVAALRHHALLSPSVLQDWYCCVHYEIRRPVCLNGRAIAQSCCMFGACSSCAAAARTATASWRTISPAQIQHFISFLCGAWRHPARSYPSVAAHESLGSNCVLRAARRIGHRTCRRFGNADRLENCG